MPMDKMEAHLRQQLSAMMDGELSSDEARFLFRRLQHDHELAGCWERWQVCSVVLRGQGEALLPADFSRRVALALVQEGGQSLVGQAAATGTHSRRWAWWGGGAALAASLALLTVVPRQGSDLAGDANARVATTATSPATPASQPSTSERMPVPTAPSAAAGLASALAVADVPRRIAARRGRGSSPDVRRTQEPRIAAVADSGQRVAAAEPLNLPARGNPFSAQDLSAQEAEPASRPWPRAVLPGANSGAFTASYSTGETGAFSPFEPRALQQAMPADSAPLPRR